MLPGRLVVDPDDVWHRVLPGLAPGERADGLESPAPAAFPEQPGHDQGGLAAALRELEAGHLVVPGAEDAAVGVAHHPEGHAPSVDVHDEEDLRHPRGYGGEVALDLLVVALPLPREVIPRVGQTA